MLALTIVTPYVQLFDIVISCAYMASALQPWIALIVFILLITYIPLRYAKLPSASGFPPTVLLFLSGYLNQEATTILGRGHWLPRVVLLKLLRSPACINQSPLQVLFSFAASQ